MSDAHCPVCAAGVELQLRIVRGVADVAINYELTNNAEVARTLRALADVLESSPDSPDGMVSVLP